jgi:hypothetical protein
MMLTDTLTIRTGTEIITNSDEKKIKMKKIFYPLALLLFVSVFTACENEDVIEQVTNETESSLNMESELSLRASSLGYSDISSYITNVHQQCLAENHTNCDVLADGNHQPCTHSSHSGTKHDGTHFSYFEFYNKKRPHQSLDYLCPLSVYKENLKKSL